MNKPVRLSAVAVVLVVLVVSVAPAAAMHRKPFNLNLCAVAGGAVAAGHVIAACTMQATTTTPGKRTALGTTATVVTYTAHWGPPSSTAHPTHYAFITVAHATGSPEGVALFQQVARAKLSALRDSLPVTIGGGTGKSVLDESACVNPPSEECLNGTLLALKGNFYIAVSFVDFPPTVPGAPELQEAEKQQVLRQQDELDHPLLNAIGQAVAARV